MPFVTAKTVNQLAYVTKFKKVIKQQPVILTNCNTM